MIEILTQTNQMQNVYTPLPLSVHFVFCVLATILYLVQFYRKGASYYLILMSAVDLTIITQFWTSSVAICALGIAEAVLLIVSAVKAFSYNKQLKMHRSEIIAQQQEEEAKATAVEKAQREHDKNTVDNAFDD